MKSPTSLVWTLVLGLVVLAAVAPLLVSLSHALVPVIVVGAIAVIAVRLVFFHTRNF
jgi:hypothetical protein